MPASSVVDALFASSRMEAFLASSSLCFLKALSRVPGWMGKKPARPENDGQNKYKSEGLSRKKRYNFIPVGFFQIA